MSPNPGCVYLRVSYEHGPQPSTDTRHTLRRCKIVGEKSKRTTKNGARIEYIVFPAYYDLSVGSVLLFPIYSTLQGPADTTLLIHYNTMSIHVLWLACTDNKVIPWTRSSLLNFSQPTTIPKSCHNFANRFKGSGQANSLFSTSPSSVMVYDNQVCRKIGFILQLYGVQESNLHNIPNSNSPPTFPEPNHSKAQVMFFVLFIYIFISSLSLQINRQTPLSTTECK